MASTNNTDKKYPLLEEILELESLPLQAMYSTRDLARIFKVSARAIQHRIASGKLVPRELPGRANFLAQDIEEFLCASRKAA
jgi:hypothetical protein